MIPEIDKPGTEYRFGNLRLIPSRQLLLHDGVPLPLGSRALDILHLLVSRAGELVSKDDLRRFVWPDMHLHESNLKVHMSMLRRALPKGAEAPYIATIPGRGYRFVAPVEVGTSSTASRLAELRSLKSDLPAIPDMIGRNGDLADLADMIRANDLVTIVGPAGVGKTTLAVAAAMRSEDCFPDGICFIDLATIDDSRLVPAAIAMAVGLEPDTDALAGLVDALQRHRMLLLLDNCEHVLSAVTTITDVLLASVPCTRILATSREALRSRSEAVFRLAPLACPKPNEGATAADAVKFTAVALFVRRAEEAHGYRFNDADAPTVGAICRRLDGLALAIELAVPRLASSGPAALLELIEGRFALLALGDEGGRSRHQTLQATLEWSYRLLSRGGARLLRLLSVFAGLFLMEDVLGVVDDLDGAFDEIVARVGDLVAKSLLVASFGQGGMRYRLLESTRGFAVAALTAEGEGPAAHARHARHFAKLFERAEDEWQWRDRKDWTAAYASRSHDVRKALDWAFGDDGDAELGIRLTVAAIPLWEELSSVTEGHVRVERALRKISKRRDVEPGLRMKLMVSHGTALNFSDCLGADVGTVWEESYRLAVDLGSVEYQLRALWGHAILQSFSGSHRQALSTLETFMNLAAQENESSALPDGRRVMLMTQLYLGKIPNAMDGLLALEREQSVATTQIRMARFQVDRLVGIRVGLAYAAWICGEHLLAEGMADAALARAAELSHRVSQTNALAQIGLPLALQVGDIDLLRRRSAMLEDNLALHETAIWSPVSRFYLGVIASRDGSAEAIDLMCDAVEMLRRNNFLIRMPMYLAILAEEALRHGRLVATSTALDLAVSYVRSEAELWYAAEISRVRGLLEWRLKDWKAAETSLSAAKREAAAVGAIAFELRAATNLAELLVERERSVEARAQLTSVYARLDPRSGSSDVRRARELLDSIDHRRD